MDIVNPATGEVITSVDRSGPGELADALGEARDAQKRWRAAPLTERVDVVSRFARLVEQRTEDLAAILTREVGKPIGQSRGELRAVIERFDYFCDQAEAVLGDEVVRDSAGMVEVLKREPLGVVANISAWNYPWFVGSNVFGAALVAGNAVLYKPSEHATLTGSAIGRLMAEAGLPEGLLQVVVGDGQTGAQLLEQPVDGVFFTGSRATGLRIAEAMATRLIPVQLELGGKDPVYVTDDVDVAATAEATADGAFYNTGQSCCSVERIYVHRAVAEVFMDRFVEAVEGYKLGDPFDEETYIGPLAREEQVGVLEAQVADALERGATLLTGGHRVSDRPGGWFEPTVLTDVSEEMLVMSEESFGPIIAVAVVADDDEALARMDDTEYGLTAGVFCSDQARAQGLLEQLDVGTAYWNCCDRVSPRLPWSGRRASGVGMTLGRDGMRAFTKPKAYQLRGA